MSLRTGARIGPYEVVARVGAGGMGEVYRARDTKLGRDVALKVLPDVFARDPDRLARFAREAQVLASLNHPNIATAHGLEDAAGLINTLLSGASSSPIVVVQNWTPR
jgi:serine/threonine protein kinase